MINRKKILNFLGFSIVALALVNMLAVNSGWYYIYKWFDLPMHFFGGLVTLFLVAYVFYNKIGHSTGKFTFLIIMVMLGGLFWEFYEYFVSNVWAGKDFDMIDTLSDLLMDFLGGLFGILIIKKNGN